MAYTLRGSVLTAGDAGDSDYYGSGVSLSGNGLVLAVGAQLWDGSVVNKGAVYIYDWSGSAWVQRGIIEGDYAGSSNFAISCALNYNGTILAVGAADHSATLGQKGAVFVYDWSGSAWVARGTYIKASDKADYDYFGASVALSDSGSILVVGATGWEGSLSNQGAVYVYDWSGSAWGQRAILTATDAAASDGFGTGVAISGDGVILAVGASGWESGLTNNGAVYIYDWSGSAWAQRGSGVFPSDYASYDYFGTSVALTTDGGKLAVGAIGQVNTVTTGCAYVFSWSGSAWVEDEKILAADYGLNDRFGASIALSGNGNVLAIGATGWEGAATDQGGVYIYDVPSVTPEGIIEVASPLGAAIMRAYVGEPPLARVSADSPLGAVALVLAGVLRYAHFYSLSAYISGDQDGLSDYVIPLASFGLSKRNAAASYYSISAPFSDDLLTALSDRPNGIIHISRDGYPWESFNVSHPIRYDIGPRSASISISGTRQSSIVSSATLALTLDVAMSDSINSDGILTLDLVPGIVDPRPGDSITWGGDSYTVTLKKYQANASGQTLSINAEAV